MNTNIPSGRVEQAVAGLYRNHFGKMVSGLLNLFRDLNLETIEDLVQDAFATALTTWGRDGIPTNPGGWVYVVARNKILNQLAANRKTSLVADPVVGDQPSAEPVFKEAAVDDEQLRLLFACAHPDLSPKVQVVITLKYVMNLKVEAIARALGMGVDGIDKLLSRARKKIREEKIFLVEPGAAGLVGRLAIVHKIIYLMYSEGYKPAAGKDILQEELCGEALLLSKALMDNRLGDQTTAALHALMLFNAARFKARFRPGGELLDLEQQDRSLWSRPLISMGCDYLLRSKGDVVSPYHFEASIAYLHCTAADFQSTDWVTISKLYEQLLEHGENPFVELNYAIAVFYRGDAERAFEILHGLLKMSFLNQYFLLNATLGKLYLLEGKRERAREYFVRALGQTDSPLEQEFIRGKIDMTSPSAPVE